MTLTTLATDLVKPVAIDLNDIDVGLMSSSSSYLKTHLDLISAQWEKTSSVKTKWGQFEEHEPGLFTDFFFITGDGPRSTVYVFHDLFRKGAYTWD